MMLESAVEERLVKEVKARRGWAIKFIPVVRGLPDRIVLLPGGRIFFVELKRPKGGVVSGAQRVVHSKLRRLGFQVDIVSSIDEVLAWTKVVDGPSSGSR